MNKKTKKIMCWIIGIMLFMTIVPPWKCQSKGKTWNNTKAGYHLFFREPKLIITSFMPKTYRISYSSEPKIKTSFIPQPCQIDISKLFFQYLIVILAGSLAAVIVSQKEKQND